METRYVYFVSFSYPSVKSVNPKNKSLVGLPLFGDCEIALENKIEDIGVLRDIRDKLEKDRGLKNVVIISFQLLRVDNPKVTMAQRFSDKKAERKRRGGKGKS